MKHLLYICLALGCLASCSGSSINVGFQRKVSYSRSAQKNYAKGIAELKDENFQEALKYFVFTKAKFPFSRFATLSELRIADTYFAQEKFVDAIDAYKQFQKFHPSHPQVLDGYAAYRVCKAYVKQIPSDWFLIPPSHEKDQGATRDAILELNAFRRSHEGSKYMPKVTELYRKCIRRMAEHELYVARFYLRRDKPKATILRLEALLKRYPSAGVDPEVMLLLGKTYLKLEKHGLASKTFRQLTTKYPKSPHAARARLFLGYLASNTPKPAPASQPPAATSQPKK